MELNETEFCPKRMNFVGNMMEGRRVTTQGKQAILDVDTESVLN